MTLEIWVPIFRWTLQQRTHRKHPREDEAHFGSISRIRRIAYGQSHVGAICEVTVTTSAGGKRKGGE